MKLTFASIAAAFFALCANNVVVAQHDFGVAVRGLGVDKVEVFDRRQESAGLPDQIAVQGIAGGEVIPYPGDVGAAGQKRQESAGLPDEMAVKGLAGGIVVPYKREVQNGKEALGVRWVTKAGPCQTGISPLDLVAAVRGTTTRKASGVSSKAGASTSELTGD